LIDAGTFLCQNRPVRGGTKGLSATVPPWEEALSGSGAGQRTVRGTKACARAHSRPVLVASLGLTTTRYFTTL
jgi:hypothetical protein